MNYELALGLSATPTRPDHFENMYFKFFSHIVECKMCSIDKLTIHYIFYK